MTVLALRTLMTAAGRFVRSSRLVLLGALAWSGCATGDYAFVTRISTGEKIQIPLAHGAPLHAKKGTIEVVYAAMIPGLLPEKKEMVYLFAFNETSGRPPRSVRVEDVSDDAPVLLVEDLKPELRDKTNWRGKSASVPSSDPSLIWFTYLDDTMRVFRFTIVNADGETVVLNQGWYVPGWIKPGIRRSIGMDPMPAK